MPSLHADLLTLTKSSTKLYDISIKNFTITKITSHIQKLLATKGSYGHFKYPPRTKLYAKSSPETAKHWASPQYLESECPPKCKL